MGNMVLLFTVLAAGITALLLTLGKRPCDADAGARRGGGSGSGLPAYLRHRHRVHCGL